MAMQSIKNYNIQRPEARVICHPATLRQRERDRQCARVLSVPMIDGIRRVQLESIICCSADGNYCRITLSNSEELYFAKTLKWVSQRLPEMLFVRVHASHLVSIKHVAHVKPDRIRLTNGLSVPVSRSRKAKVKAKLP